MPTRPTLPSTVARLTAALTIAAGAAAAPASAAPYTVRPCAGPGSPAPYTGSGLLSTDGNTTVDNRCTAGLGYRLRFHGPDDTILKYQGNGFRLMVPAKFPNAKILSVGGNITVAARTGASGSLFLIDETNGGYDPIGGPRLTYSDGAQLAPETYFQVPAVPSRSLIWRFTSDDATTYDPTVLGGDIVLNGLAVKLDDSTAPQPATAPATGLLDGTPQVGKRILSVSGTDLDSGMASLAVMSGTTRVAWFVNGPTRCTYAGVGACPSTITGDLVVDTTALADGPQTLTLVSTDGAGNMQSSTTPSFVVANHTPPTPAPLPLNGDPKGTAIVTAGQRSTTAAGAATASAPWHSIVTVSGRLLAADRTPMPGTTLDITQTGTLPGAVATKLATVTTDATGAYHYSFTASSSATIAVLYPQHLGAADYATGRSITLAVRAHVTLHRSGGTRPGKVIRFTGHVDAASLPPTGARVALEYHSKQGAWLTAGIATTTAAGDFAWQHRFLTAAAYRFRARVLSDKQLPAAPGTSGELRFRLR